MVKAEGVVSKRYAFIGAKEKWLATIVSMWYSQHVSHVIMSKNVAKPMNCLIRYKPLKIKTTILLSELFLLYCSQNLFQKLNHIN